MAAQSLGALFVELLFKDAQFTAGMAKSSAALRAFSADVGNVTNAISGKFETAMKAATAAIAAMATASAVVGAEFEQKITKVAVIAGESVDQLAEAARRMGASTQFSAIEAADAMESLAQAGFHTKEIIAGTEAALALAAASGGKLADATSIVASTMSQFGLDADNATRIADVYTQALNSSQLGMTDLAVAMSYAGTVGAGFGHTLEETTAAVAMFSNLGLEGSKAGTAFRMAMSQAATVSKVAEETLSKYNNALTGTALTAKDINPELHNFGEILDIVGKAGITASDAMLIFGTEVGANVVTLAKQSQEAGRDIRTTFAGITEELLGSSGKAASTAESMTATVLGAFEEASGAFEEVLLTLFFQYAASLQGLLRTVAGFFQEVGRQFKVAGAVTSSSLGGALDDLSAWLAANSTKFAAMLVIWTQRTIEAGRALAPLIQYLDEILLLMGAVWAVGKVMAFASALSSAYQGVLLLQGALVALGYEITVGTAGFYAAVVAITALVAVLVDYATTTDSATEAAERLTRAQEQQAARNALWLEVDTAATGRRLAVQQEAARAELASSAELSDARREELRQILALDAAAALAAETKGELVRVDGELRTAESLVAEAATGNAEALAAAQARAARVVQGRIRDAEEIKAAVDAAAIAAAKGSDLEAIALANVQAEYAAAAAEVEAARAAEIRLKNDVVLAQREVQEGLLREQRAREQGARSTADFSVKERRDSDETATRLEADRARVGEATARLYQDAADLAASAGLSEVDAARAALGQRIRDLARAFDEEAALWSGNAEQVASIERRKLEAIANIRAAAAREELAEARKMRDELLAALPTDDTFTGLGSSIEGATSAVEAMGSKLGPLRVAWLAVGAAVGGVGSTAASVVGTLGGAAGGLVGALSGVVSGVTGFGVSLDDVLGGITEAQDAARAAAEEKARAAGADDAGIAAAGAAAAAGVDQGAAASGAVAGLFSDATAFADTLVQAVGPALTALADGIPGLIDTVVQQLPVLVNAIATGVPLVIDAIIVNLPKLLGAVLDGLVSLVGQVVEVLPGLLTTLLGTVLPRLIGMLAAAIPVLITTLAEAIPGIVTVIVDSLPGIINALILAIPGIVTALVGAIPELLIAVIQGVPSIVFALIQALPTLLGAILGMIPSILGEVIIGLPQIAIAMVKEIPRMALKFIKSITGAVGQFGEAFIASISGGITDLFKKGGVKDVFGGLFGGKGGQGAYSGIEYVPATMRMTLHKGEAVVDANRNAVRQAGGPSTAGAYQEGLAGGGGGAVELAVLVDGQVVDGALISAVGKGRAPGIQRMIRSASGVQVGFDRGRYSPWSKGKRR